MFNDWVSGVGTVAASAATLFRPYINIHNQPVKLAQASLVLSSSFFVASSLHQSHTQLHAYIFDWSTL